MLKSKLKLRRTPLFQAVCNGPTPLGPAYPRGMFGAIELGQEEAVKFYQAWKAEVVLNVNNKRYSTFPRALET